MFRANACNEHGKGAVAPAQSVQSVASLNFTVLKPPAGVAAEALVQASQQPRGKQIMAPLRGVQFIEGRPPSATVQNGVLVLKLDVSRGDWSGRPSSRRILNVVVTSVPVGSTARR